MKNILKLIASVAICQAAGLIGAFFTTPAVNGWYQTLNKPSFTPPGSLIGAVWTVLFLLIGIALHLVWLRNFKVRLSLSDRLEKTWNPWSKKLFSGRWREENVVLVFAVQLALNILWSICFFALQYPGLAFFELLMLWVAIMYTIVNFYRVSKLAGYLLIPYILWVTFAGFLNYRIWMMN